MPGVGSLTWAGLQSNGRTLVLTVGRRLVVSLATGWTAPRAEAADGSVSAGLQPLAVLDAVGFPAAKVAAATFLAVRTGTSVVAAVTDYACLYGTPRCALPQRMFRLLVRVLPPPGAGVGPLPKPVR
jgi:hypothetical protein